MFGKRMKRELKWLLRRLWPFAVAWAVATPLAVVMILFDRNPVEATGTVMGYALGFFAAGALVLGVAIFGNISLIRGLQSQDRMPGETTVRFFGAKFLVCFILLFLATFLAVMGTLPYTWSGISSAFAHFNTEWRYFLEGFIFAIVLLAFCFLAPVAFALAFFARPMGAIGVLAVIFGIVSIVLLLPMFVFEIQLLLHSESTNMQGLWPTVIVMLSFYALMDVGAYATIGYLLKRRGDAV